MRRLVLLLSLSAAPLLAQDIEPYQLLGLTPEAVYAQLGAPMEVFSAPIDATHYHVGHLYSRFLTVYWFDNHVWQVRIDRRSTLAFVGLRIGQTRTEIDGLLGPAKVQSAPGAIPDWAAWPLPFQSFPRVLKLGFENGLLVDALLSRGDLP